MNKNYLKLLMYSIVFVALFSFNAVNASDLSDVRLVRNFAADIINPDPLVKGRKENKERLAFLDNIAAIKLIVVKPQLLKKALELGKEGSPSNANEITKYFNNLDLLTPELKKQILASDTPDDLIKEAIENISDEKFADLDFIINAFVGAYKFDMIGKKLAQIEMPKGAGQVGQFVLSVLKNYFPKQTTEDKRFIIATLLRSTMPKDADELKLLAIIKAAGPFFHKIIQLVGDYVPETTAEGRKLKEVLNEVKRNLLPISDYDLSNLVKEVEDASNGRLKIDIIKTLGIASIGHALLVKVTDTQNNAESKIVLKFIKPGVTDRAYRDVDIILPLAFHDEVMSFFKGTIDDILGELDFTHEFENLTAANSIYNSNDPNDRIKAVTSVPNFPVGKNWLAMSLAPGRSFADFGKGTVNTDEEKLDRKIEYLVQGMALEELAKKWMLKAFFGQRNGLYHADLHAGNVLIDIKTDDIKSYLKNNNSTLNYEALNKDMINKIPKENYTVTLIDFGNVGYLNPSERLNVLNFFISTINEIHSWDGFVESYLNLVGIKLSSEKEKALKEAIKKVFDETKDQEALLGQLISFFLTGDYPQLPSTMATFGRSQAMLNNVFNGVQRQASKFNFRQESFDFGGAILADMKKLLTDGTFLVFSRVDVTGNQLYLNIGNLNAVVKYGARYGIQWIKDKLSIGKMPIGGVCITEFQCQGFSSAGRKGVACCRGICEEKKKDWAGVYYCPFECVGKVFGKAGTCN